MAVLPQPTSDDSERRIAPRSRTLKRAKILFNNRYSTFDCIVRNISATGALLTIDPAAPLPRTFEIRIGDEETLRPAKLVYRRELFAGIHFLDAPDEDESEAPHAAAAHAFDEPEPAEFANLRIHAKPLPQALVGRFPWTRI